MGHHVFRVPSTWREPISITLSCNSRVRKWAYDNAWTLIFVAVLFVPTWLALGYLIWKVHGPL